jgi:diamine N-acetyltransferase
VIFLKKLGVKHAYTSFLWRNDKEVWKYTKHRPSKKISLQEELLWIRKVLKRKKEKRYAIVVKQSNKYIGNLYFTGIKNRSAEFHIFVGDRSEWGKGYGCAACSLALAKAKKLGLKKVYLVVSRKNIYAMNIYLGLGFQRTGNCKTKGFITMSVAL